MNLGGPRVHGLPRQWRWSSRCRRWPYERYGCLGLRLGPLYRTEWVAGPGSPCRPLSPHNTRHINVWDPYFKQWPSFPSFSFTSPELDTSIMGKWHLPNVIDKLSCQGKKGPVKANRWARTRPFPAGTCFRR